MLRCPVVEVDVDVDGIVKLPLPLLNGENQIDKRFYSDGLSITELYYIEKGENWTSDPLQQETDVENQLPICLSKGFSLYKQKTTKAIEKVLQFYATHEDVVLREARDLAGLSILKAVEDKYARKFQTVPEISTWLQRTCNQVAPKEKEFCFKTTTIWNYHHKGNNWKSANIIDKIRSSSVAPIGQEKEYTVSVLNGHCQVALLTACQVPHVCEKTLYDPVPRSQYYLAHQILQRIFTEQSDCPEAKQFLSEEINDQLCSKMYQEAQLISEMGYPQALRDIFVEHVALCGFLRYPNFFREDWIKNIVSWQSESEYGCFVHDKGYLQRFWTSDAPITRRSSPEEKRKGLMPDEECLPHLTVYALSALAMSWDYMEENCE
ncbi:unnamed protein product [Orchesella dallaii]|uniref:Uncharacterized protein n=1 Tax=Orchesella dallaii TaxID=48710 RepID=A0ABP1PL69_9HEXA